VQDRGRLLFGLDRAAWVATDDLLERIPDAQTAGVRGYVVERDGSAFIATFFGGPEAAPVAFYRGRVENHRVVDREVYAAAARPALTPLQRRLAAVRDMGARLGRRPCGDQPFNTAAIPPQTPDGPIDLYLLTPQTTQNVFPLGGHYRFTVGADGAVQSSREFMRTCLAMDSRQGLPPGARPVGIAVNHVLDPHPTEIHVFTALTSGLDVFVTAGGRQWQVARDRIRLQRQAPPPSKG
jgi:hypothetical protein